MTQLNDDFLDQTRLFWRRRTQRTLTREDARQIVENVTSFLQILAEWDRIDRGKTEDDSST